MAGGFHVYSHIPIYEASAPESGVFLTWVGKCSTSNESHGYWWKVNSNHHHHHHHHSNGNDNNRTTTKGDEQKSGSKEKPPTGKSEPSSTTPWGDTLSSYFGMAPKKGAASDSLLHAPPKGKSALQRHQQQPRQKADSDGSGISSVASPALPPSPPLGLGIVFFTEDDIVTGVLIAGNFRHTHIHTFQLTTYP